jgi:hypothetical protein
MPRKARVKTPEGIFHVMYRSIRKVNLFKDDTDISYFPMSTNKRQFIINRPLKTPL